jgi:hypothetical protein
MTQGPRASITGRSDLAPRRLRDPHADLLRDTRGMPRDQAVARETWLAALSLERKEDVLLELEVTLKGVVLWADPRLQPTRPGLPPLRDRDFRPHVGVTLAALSRAHSLAGRLLGAGHLPGALPRRLPVGFSEASRTEAWREAPALTPVESLAALRSAIGVAREIMQSLARVERLPHRVFFAALTTLRREVERNACFNPLTLLEFRPEFDRIRSPEVLESLQLCDTDTAHRLVSLTFLSHFRLLRVVQMMAAAAADPSSPARAYVFLPVLRAESDALLDVLRDRAGALLADTLEREVLRLLATDVRSRFDSLTAENEQLGRIRAAMTAAALSLRASVRRALERVIAPCGAPVTEAASLASFLEASGQLTETLQHGILRMVEVFRPGSDPERAVGDPGARRGATSQVRQWSWIFALVTRGFVAKARLARHASFERWSAAPSHEFIAEYLRHYRELGQALAYETLYPHRDRLTHALTALSDVDFVDDLTLDSLVADCEAFGAHLQLAVTSASERPEMRGVPLNRERAGELLRLHLLGVAPVVARALDALPPRS